MPPRFEASVTVPGVAFENVTVSPAPTVADVGEGPVGVRVTVTLAAPATPAMAREARPTTVRRGGLLVRCILILRPLRRAAKLLRIRMGRNFGVTMLTMTRLSAECLMRLTKLGYDATPF